MRYYFAPMEGITCSIFRNAHARWFGGVDKYYMPFLSPSQEHSFTRKGFHDLLPEHNVGVPAVPQLLTKCAADFLWAAGALQDMGYGEINLNLGCPSGTVTAKGKGAGFLGDPEGLDRFLDEIFSAATVEISVKTRLGVRSDEEFEVLLEIYNKYPISELTIHPRVRADFYKNKVHMEVFARALPRSRNPVCYNGDLTGAADCLALADRFPAVGAIMLGRGLCANPGLALQARGGAGASKAALRGFHDEIYTGYTAAFGERRNAMRRMKELWSYLICLFEDSDAQGKRLRKATDPADYEAVVDSIFHNLDLRQDA
ncbi:MAG: tRNA-dihydrouridine synthase family protein, partial [Pseudoflavonifractor sp.]